MRLEVIPAFLSQSHAPSQGQSKLHHDVGDFQRLVLLLALTRHGTNSIRAMARTVPIQGKALE
jgi:hypothetical protein